MPNMFEPRPSRGSVQRARAGKNVAENRAGVIHKASPEWKMLVYGIMRDSGEPTTNPLAIFPNLTQRKPIEYWESGGRFICIIGGERSGKSVVGGAIAALGVDPFQGGGGDGWIVGPDYRQARAEFGYIFGILNRAGLVQSFSMPEAPSMPWVVRLKTGNKIETRTSNEIMSLASFTIDWFIMAEAAQQNEAVWRKLRGRVAQRRGWGIMSGTIEKGLPWFGELADQWETGSEPGHMAFRMPSWSNLAVYPGGRQDPEMVSLERGMPEGEFKQRFAAESYSHVGRVIPEFEYKKHVADLEVLDDVPVELAIDPGTRVYAVLFVQRFGVFLNVLDRVYMHDCIGDEVIEVCKKNPLWSKVIQGPPPQARIDWAGSVRNAGKSQVTVWRELAGLVLAWKKIYNNNMMDPVRAFRYRLRTMQNDRPLIMFDRRITNKKRPDGSAADVLAEFELWRWPEGSMDSNERLVPIDRDNHALKALGYYCYGVWGPLEQKKQQVQRDRYMTSVNDYFKSSQRVARW